jgi:hypothetical protein
LTEKSRSLIDRVVRLSYVNEGWPLGQSAIESLVAPYPTVPTNTMKNVPKQADSKRSWGELVIGPHDQRNRIPYIVDESAAGITMYMDLDQDGDFANNPPIRNYDFHRLDLRIRYGSKWMPYRMCFIIRDRGNFFYSICHLRGQLEMHNESYPIAIFDNPPDGDYSNDSVHIDLNRNGKADPGEKFTTGGRIEKLGVTLKSVSPAGDEIHLLFDN